MKPRTIKYALSFLSAVIVSVTTIASSQGFDLMNVQSKDKVAESSLYNITKNGIEQFRSTSVSKPFAIVTGDTFHITLDNNTTTISQGAAMPTISSLQQNYPNPFNSSTVIRFSVYEKSDVTIKVYDITGREVTTLVNGTKYNGMFSVGFDNVNISSGTYIYQMVAQNASGNTTVETKKMIVMK